MPTLNYRIRALAAKQVDKSPGKVSIDHSLAKWGGDQIKLEHALEHTFDIDISTKEREQCETLEDFADLVRSKLSDQEEEVESSLEKVPIEGLLTMLEEQHLRYVKKKHAGEPIEETEESIKQIIEVLSDRLDRVNALVSMLPPSISLTDKNPLYQKKLNSLTWPHSGTL